MDFDDLEFIVGRPTKYKGEETCYKLLKYFDREPVLWARDEDGNKTKRIAVNDFPTIEGFCCSLGISRPTFYKWIKKYDELLEAYEVCRCKQIEFLVNNGLNQTYSGYFSQFILTNISSDYKKDSEDKITEQEIILKVDNDDINL